MPSPLVTLISATMVGLVVAPSAITSSPGDSEDLSVPHSGGEIIIEEGLSAPEVEASEVAENLHDLESDPDSPVITGYEARLLEESYPGEFSGVTAVTVPFALPDGCFSLSNETLQCSDGEVVFSPVVFDGDHQVLDAVVSTSASDIEVTVPVSDSATYPLVVAVNIAAPEDAELIPVAEEAFQDMLSGNVLTDEEIQQIERELFPELADTNEETVFSFSSDAQQSGAVAAYFPLSGKGSDSLMTLAFTRPSKVTIPASYRYCPNTCNPKSLHDYCTWSPDWWRNADFRGPCARHDIGIDTIRKKNISASTKRTQRAAADTVFHTTLRRNCGYAYYSNVSPNRVACYGAAATYYAAVKGKTTVWNGK